MSWRSLSKTLNITNGDGAVTALQCAGIQGDFLPWRDVLHLGPLLPGDLMGCFEHSRVLFLSQFFGMPGEVVREKFRNRSQFLKGLSSYQCIRLWFEHDLYDQLQLIQVLAHLSGETDTPPLRWVVTDQYIGSSNDMEIHELLRFDQPVPPPCLIDAKNLWGALTQSDPNVWAEYDCHSLSEWSFIGQTLLRLKNEFPDRYTGLSQSQSMILALLQVQSENGSALFRKYSQQEWGQFMGDAVFEKELQAMLNVNSPLLSKEKDLDSWWSDHFTITPMGLDVLNGKKNHVKVNGIDKWIAGTHLKQDHCWWLNKEVNQLER